MRLSKYDPDGDGVCDPQFASVCQNVLTAVDFFSNQTALIARDLRFLGITLNIKSGLHPGWMQEECGDPRNRVGLCPSVGWVKDYGDGFSVAGPLFASASIGPAGCCNYSLVGASSSLLKKDGYKTTHVPSVDARINRCETLLGAARPTCWAGLDRYLMEKVVPIVPLQFDNTVNVLSKRVACYSFDQFTGVVALDHVCLSASKK